MRHLTLALCTAAVIASTLGAQATVPSARRRVAVLDFDYASVQGNAVREMGSAGDIGKGIHVLVESELARTGVYAVIERAQVDRILGEQNFQQNWRADASSAARLGKLLGADAIIIGAVTRFERENNSIAFGFKKESKATVMINARIVGIKTAEILAVAEGRGESKRSQMNTDDDQGRNVSRRPGDVWSTTFGSTILGEATRAAVDSLVIQLAAAADKIPESAAAISALVADVSGDQLVINVGTAGGVRVGAEYPLMRPGREIKDPATGNVLRRATVPVGKIRITSAEEGSATGTLTGDAAHVGDCVASCPLAPVGRSQAPPEQASSLVSSTTPSSVVSAPLPRRYPGAVSGAFMWNAYAFAGSEHFRYDAFVNGGRPQSGYYEIDASPAAGGRVDLRIQGQLGARSYSTIATFSPNDPAPTTQLMQIGPAGMLLFTYGVFLNGRQIQLGQDLSSALPGQGYSMKAESTCVYAGMQGLDVVMRQNGNVIVDLCVSPNVALPLAVAAGPGMMGYSVKLAQYQP